MIPRPVGDGHGCILIAQLRQKDHHQQGDQAIAFAMRLARILDLAEAII
jgi:hypothetical protein